MEREKYLKEPEFRIPEGYFDGLEKRMEARLAGQKPAGKVIPLRRRIVQCATAAAVLAALVFGVWAFWPAEDKAGNELVMTGEAAHDFFNRYLDDRTDYATDETSDVVELLPDDLLLVENASADRYEFYPVDSASVEQYIYDNYNIMELATL